MRNSAWGEASFPGSKQQALAKTGGPVTVGKLWKTPCLGVETEKLSEERMSLKITEIKSYDKIMLAKTL